MDEGRWGKTEGLFILSVITGWLHSHLLVIEAIRVSSPLVNLSGPDEVGSCIFD